MGERIASWVAVAILGTVLVMSYWYAGDLRAGSVRDVGRIGRVDFYADNVVLTEFDAQGRPNMRVFADKVTHYDETDDADLLHPRALSLRPDRPQLQVVSDTAHTVNDFETVDMRGHVVATRAGTATRPPLRMETEEMLVIPDQDRMQTEHPVTIDSGASHLQAVGMDYNNITDRMVLHSRVAGRFPPRENP